MRLRRAGNHAQALALAARENGIPAHIIMPSISNPMKVAATKGYGANVYFSGSTAPEREALASEVMKETGSRMVAPYDHLDVILGQGRPFSLLPTPSWRTAPALRDGGGEGDPCQSARP